MNSSRPGAFTFWKTNPKGFQNVFKKNSFWKNIFEKKSKYFKQKSKTFFEKINFRPTHIVADWHSILSNTIAGTRSVLTNTIADQRNSLTHTFVDTRSALTNTIAYTRSLPD